MAALCHSVVSVQAHKNILLLIFCVVDPHMDLGQTARVYSLSWDEYDCFRRDWCVTLEEIDNCKSRRYF